MDMELGNNFSNFYKTIGIMMMIKRVQWIEWIVEINKNRLTFSKEKTFQIIYFLRTPIETEAPLNTLVLVAEVQYYPPLLCNLSATIFSHV